MGNIQSVKQSVQSGGLVSVNDFMEKQKDLIARVLPKTITPERLIGIFSMILKSSPKIAECSQQSLISAVIQTAQLGLQPGNMGHIHLVPFNNKGKMEVQLIIGYKGLVELVNRSGEATILTAEVVKERDQFQYELGLNPILRHIPASGDRGKMIGVYCIAKNTIANEKVFVYMQEDEIDKVRKASKAGSSEYSPWNTWPEEMAKKTAVKRISKLLPLSAESQQAIAADETIKTKIDEKMVDLPDETRWEGVEDAQTVEKEQPKPQQKAGLEPQEAQQEAKPSKATHDGVSLADVPLNGSISEIELLVKSVKEVQYEKDGQKKFRCTYVVEDAGGREYSIMKFGQEHEGVVDNICLFLSVEVGEFKGERQYKCAKILTPEEH